LSIEKINLTDLPMNGLSPIAIPQDSSPRYVELEFQESDSDADSECERTVIVSTLPRAKATFPHPKGPEDFYPFAGHNPPFGLNHGHRLHLIVRVIFHFLNVNALLRLSAASWNMQHWAEEALQLRAFCRHWHFQGEYAHFWERLEPQGTELLRYRCRVCGAVHCLQENGSERQGCTKALLRFNQHKELGWKWNW